MLEYLKSFEFASILALYIYWIPTAICTCVYFLRSVGLYQQDLQKCQEKFYTPQLTVGLITWFVILSITPCVNLLAVVFDCASSVFKWLEKFFDIPLVPKRTNGK